ncbi:MAG: ATP-grasp domain-containing protein [Clostridia bacterium]|nr:ATP-grasp domain-containing protein [Clostridia bacterium]
MKKRIWFNHWFSTAYHFIKLIKNNPDKKEFEIFATNTNPYSVIFQACDVYEVEPVLPTDDYIEYCLEYCKKNRIDVFVPRHEMLAISKNVKAFEAIGTKVLVCSDTGLLDTVMDKAKFYDFCKKENLAGLPLYRVVNNAEQFKEAYEEISEKGWRVCFKPVYAEGGAGFRVIDDKAGKLKSLFGFINHRIHFEDAYRILSSEEQFDDLMVLEYLEGVEYSMDCLGNNGLLACVPRKKVDSRVRVLEEVPELMEMAKKLSEIVKLPYVYNIQVKYNQGVPKLLEINPRMSGGLHISCLSGLNFPYLAVKLLLEGAVEVPKPRLGITAAQIETEMIVHE